MKAGWVVKKLGMIAEVGAGNSAPQGKHLFENGIHPFFRTSDAGRIRFGDIIESVDYLNDEGTKKMKLYPKDTILFPKSGASTFLNHRVMLGVNGYVSSHLATIIADSKIVNSRFLLYFLTTIRSQDLVQDQSYPSLNLSTISEISVPVPPLHEQHGIVAILDEAFAGIDAAKANAERNLNNARALFDGYLAQVFSQRGEGWVERRLNKISTVLSGFSFKSSDFSLRNVVPSIKITNVGVREFIMETDSLLPGHFLETYSDFSVPAGSIVIALTRSIISGGLKVAIVPVEYDGALLNQRVAAINADESIVLQQFLYKYLCTQSVIDYVEKQANTLMQPNLSINALRDLAIPFPPLPDQQAIVAKLDALSAETKKLEAIYRQKIAALDELKQSLLHQAFTGEL